MGHHVHPLLSSDVILKFVFTAGAFAVFQYIFKADFRCPCEHKENAKFCTIYMAFPAIIIMLLMLLINQEWVKNFPRCNYSVFCMRTCCKTFLKAVLAALLWVITALIDGDWYACIKSSQVNSTIVDQLACKEDSSMTTQEKMDIRKLLDDSRIMGLCLLAAIIVTYVVGLAVQACCCSQSEFEHDEECPDKETDNLIPTNRKRRAKHEEENVIEDISN